MKIVVQRVSRAGVSVAGERVSAIGRGLLLLVAVEHDDDDDDLAWCAAKVAGLRIFEDDAGKMNLDVRQVDGEVLAVSQFTLVGSVRKGRRPSFVGAAPPEVAQPRFAAFVDELRRSGLTVSTGVFRAMMDVELVNAGPVTLILDSRERLAPRQA